MIRVLVVARSMVMQAGLAALLSASPALSVVGTTAVLTAELLATLQPDIVLLEWESDEEETIGLLPVEESPIGVVVLVEDYSGGLNEMLRSMLRLTRGVLPQTATANEIIAAVEAAAAGLTVLHPDLLESLLPAALPAVPRPAVQPLSPREVEVLEMLAEGLGNKTIAKRLHISEHTVKFHVGSIFSKLHVSSRTEAVAIGARQGLILL